MKQKKIAILTAALVLALTLVLAAGMLVACDPTKDPSVKDPTVKDPTDDDSEKPLMTEEQFNSVVSYVYEEGEKPGVYALSYVYYFTEETLDRIDFTQPLIDLDTCKGFVECMISIEYEEVAQKEAVLLFLSSSDEASAAVERAENMDINAAIESELEFTVYSVDNVVVIESEEGMYAEHISKATLPSDMSAQRKQMLHDIHQAICGDYYGSGGINVAGGAEYVSFWHNPVHGNCYEEVGYYTVEEDDNIEEDMQNWENEKKFLTDDSIYSYTEEEGYIFESKKKKPGFSYEVIEYGNNAGQYGIDGYYHTKDVVEDLVIPAKLDGHDIVEVELPGLRAKSVTVSEGILKASISCDQERDVLQRIHLPSTLESLSLSSDAIESITIPTTLRSANFSCISLKTVNYDGSTAQFKEKFGRSANYWCTHLVYDEEAGKMVEKVITISVVCSDGTLTYPEVAED